MDERETSNNVDHGRAPATPSRGQLLGRILKSFGSRLGQTGAPADVHRVIAQCRQLVHERGEVSGARLASQVLDAYKALDPKGADAFFGLLATEFAPDADDIRRAADAFSGDPSAANLQRLQAVVEPPRQELFRCLNTAPGGTAALVQLRKQLLDRLDQHPEWAPIDIDLKHLFRSWFNRGFLTLQQIDWRTSAVILERLIQYEAVHQIQGWHDLRRRLQSDRRCYAFFSPALPDDPLIFIEVALTRGVPSRVQPLLDPDAPVTNPERCTCAAFYSITNCQEGLRGISFGNFLIKQVAADLGSALPWLRTQATISPIPGFVKWLKHSALPAGTSLSSEMQTYLERVLANEATAPPPASLQVEVRRLCAYYLLRAKRGRAPLDSVARFHLANGARLERLNWHGDTSPKGLSNSLGLSVNYRYRLGDVERNHEAFANDYEVVASRELQMLANSFRDGSAAPAGGRRQR